MCPYCKNSDPRMLETIRERPKQNKVEQLCHVCSRVFLAEKESQ